MLKELPEMVDVVDAAEELVSNIHHVISSTPGNAVWYDLYKKLRDKVERLTKL